jgi:hypothetical protein
MTPPKIISTYSDDEWEEFIREWMDGFDPPYYKHDRLGGAGDMGRDVVGYLGEPNTECEWDNYQCKHYNHPLYPSDIWVELGKLCVFTFYKKITIPRQYRFVAPQGVGTSLHDLLRQPEILREKLIEAWPSKCESGISESEKYPLLGNLLNYVQNFNFGIVGYIPVHEILKQHKKTCYWFQRFQQDPPVRPTSEKPPVVPRPNEAVYVEQLLAAYSEHLNSSIKTHQELSAYPDIEDHFKRSRGYFYAAETLNRFSRDQIEPGSFEKIKEQIFDGVIDCANSEHPNGYKRIIAVTERSQIIPLAKTSLSPYVEPGDRKGICHHLANDNKLSWIKK